MTARLEAVALSKRYGDKPALDALSFKLDAGGALALVGESGSGKSTAARLLARLEAPTSGRILLDGEDLLGQGQRVPLDYRARVQLVLQDPFASLNPARTIGAQLERPLQIHRKARGAALRERVLALLAEVGLQPAADFAARLPHQLSGGQRQRVALARALAVEPQVLIADEPTSMLDVSLRLGLLELLAAQRKARGLSLLFITHDLASARWLCDDMLVLQAGRQVEAGRAEQVISAPVHPYTRQLIEAAPHLPLPGSP